MGHRDRLRLQWVADLTFEIAICHDVIV